MVDIYHQLLIIAGEMDYCPFPAHATLPGTKPHFGIPPVISITYLKCPFPGWGDRSPVLEHISRPIMDITCTFLPGGVDIPTGCGMMVTNLPLVDI